ncbi:MAG: hypothetical protein A2041_13525 [Bacteroidetes bacterium GWA2_31_9b]|nr:MAG: hypothetical protein A2041_13525 [Bacteroidetes bacterium GWA2_31_9b]
MKIVEYILFFKVVIHKEPIMEQKLINTLIYFDLFKHPLSSKEIMLYSGIFPEHEKKAIAFLQLLLQQGTLSFYNGYYFFGSDISKYDNRMRGNEGAKEGFKTAVKFTKIIARFPFVRGVLLSGSISKSIMLDDDDIDYFIITAPNRLWIARTMLVLFRKLFLLNSHKKFCINYFVDTDNLTIKERNLYNATEIAFLIPIYNVKLHQEILRSNQWIQEFYPTFKQNGNLVFEKNFLSKKILEYLLNITIADKLETFLYEKSKVYINKKFKYYDNEMFSRCFRIKKNELRYFPNENCANIMARFNKRVEEIVLTKIIYFSDDKKNLYEKG